MFTHFNERTDTPDAVDGRDAILAGQEPLQPVGVMFAVVRTPGRFWEDIGWRAQCDAAPGPKPVHTHTEAQRRAIKVIADELMAVRQSVQLSQRMLAARIGIPHSTYQNYEYGVHAIPEDVLYRLNMAFGAAFLPAIRQAEQAA